MSERSLQEFRLKDSKINSKRNQIKTQLEGICIFNLVTQIQRKKRESAAWKTQLTNLYSVLDLHFQIQITAQISHIRCTQHQNIKCFCYTCKSAFISLTSIYVAITKCSLCKLISSVSLCVIVPFSVQAEVFGQLS